MSNISPHLLIDSFIFIPQLINIQQDSPNLPSHSSRNSFPNSFRQFLMVGGFVWEPFVLLIDHHQPLVHTTHLLVQSFLFPGGSCDNLWQSLIMNEPVSVLLVVNFKLWIFPVINDSSFFTALVILFNNLFSLLPEIYISLHTNVPKLK